MYGLPYTGHSFLAHLIVILVAQIRNIYSFFKSGILSHCNQR